MLGGVICLFSSAFIPGRAGFSVDTAAFKKMKTFGKERSSNFSFYFLVISHSKYFGTKIFFTFIFIHLSRDCNSLWILRIASGEVHFSQKKKKNATLSINLQRLGPNHSANQQISTEFDGLRSEPIAHEKGSCSKC